MAKRRGYNLNESATPAILHEAGKSICGYCRRFVIGATLVTNLFTYAFDKISHWLLFSAAIHILLTAIVLVLYFQKGEIKSPEFKCKLLPFINGRIS